MFPRSFVDVVGDGDGGSHFAEVGDDAAVQALDALVAEGVSEQSDHLRLLVGQAQVETGCEQKIIKDILTQRDLVSK